MSENHRFSDVFRGYRNVTLDGLKWVNNDKNQIPHPRGVSDSPAKCSEANAFGF